MRDCESGVISEINGRRYHLLNYILSPIRDKGIMLLLAKWYLPLCQGRKRVCVIFRLKEKKKNYKSGNKKNAIKMRPFINSLYFSEQSPPVELCVVIQHWGTYGTNPPPPQHPPLLPPSPLPQGLFPLELCGRPLGSCINKEQLKLRPLSRSFIIISLTIWQRRNADLLYSNFACQLGLRCVSGHSVRTRGGRVVQVSTIHRLQY